MTAKIKSLPDQIRSRRRHKPKGIPGHTFEKVYWPYLPLLLVIFSLVLLSTRAGVFSTPIKPPTGEVLAYATHLSNKELLSYTNQQRQAYGLKPLAFNEKLDLAAQSKANDMALRAYWSHDTPDGNPPWVFVTNQGYDYQKLGENLAAGFRDEKATINGWMTSPGHRQNILDPAYQEVGFGFANNANYQGAGGGPMTVVVASSKSSSEA